MPLCNPNCLAASATCRLLRHRPIANCSCCLSTAACLVAVGSCLRACLARRWLSWLPPSIPAPGILTLRRCSLRPGLRSSPRAAAAAAILPQERRHALPLLGPPVGRCSGGAGACRGGGWRGAGAAGVAAGGGGGAGAAGAAGSGILVIGGRGGGKLRQPGARGGGEKHAQHS